MVVSDPIADMLARVNNGYKASKVSVDLPWSKMKQSLASLFVNNGFLKNVEIVELEGHKTLRLDLKYDQKTPAISMIRRVSRPSLRVYAQKGNLPKVLGGLGMVVVSTPQGLLTDKEARKKGLGGEIICEVS